MNILKINHLEKNKIKKIFVFKGDIELNENWTMQDGTSIFTEGEMNEVQQNNTEIIMINHLIHLDDTISTLKKKIVKHTGLRISIPELYLFGIHKNIFNPTVVFNQLTQQDAITLDKNRYCDFLLNIVDSDCSSIEDTKNCSLLDSEKNQITFDEFISSNEINWDSIITTTIPIGQKLSLKKNYPFVTNPYNLLFEDAFIKNNINELLTTQNSNLLFEYGELCNNNIYLCTCEDVIDHFTGNENISQEFIFKLYFPQLGLKKEITSKSALNDSQIGLYQESMESIDENFDNYNQRIDLMYNIFYKRISDIPYENNTPGIVKLDFTIHPTYNMKFPLEILFKLINSGKTIPLIKYNPGRSRENIYRLFTNNQYATNGKNIPYLYTKNNNKKGRIIQISKMLARKKQVGFYIEYKIENKLFIITCEFEINGNINISFNHNHVLQIRQIEQIIKEAINDSILLKIKNFLEQSGYTYSLFNSLVDKNIEFNNITIISQLKLKKNIKLNNYIGCLSPLFTIINDKIVGRDGEIKMNYKRVSNFNEMDSIESFITDLRKKGEEPNVIIKLIKDNFNISIDQAKNKFAKWASEVNVETGLFENKKITIRTNTGFPVSITQDKSNFLTSLRVKSINDIRYIYHIQIFLDSLIRLFYDKTSTGISIDIINSLCKTAVEIEVPETEATEDIKNTEIKFVSEEKQQAFMNLFGATNPDDEFGIGDEEDDEGDGIDFGDVEFGEFDEVNEWNENDNQKKIEKEEEEFDFGDVNFGELEIGESIPTDIGEMPESEISESKSATRESAKSQDSIDSVNVSPASSEKSSELSVDLAGLRIEGNNNIFMQRREELQPRLFLKKQTGRFKAYSKACPSEYAKQPIILTQNEKKYIDEKDNDFGVKSYDEHITYGTGDEKYHYICPRFWCLSDDNGKSRSISFDEINNGKCGGWEALIPEGSDKVPEGGRIIQFTDKRFHKKGVKTNNIFVYKPFYPSFMGKDKHPDGLCIPCCYGKPSGVGEGDWEMMKDKKGKISYINTKTNIILKKPPPIELNTMYEPVGDGPGGPGPTFDRDENGNIIMSSVVGTKMVRENPAPSRIKARENCDQPTIENKQDINQETTDTIPDNQIRSDQDENKPIKLDEAPLLETWPHRYNQLGYLPLSVQKFMGYNCKKICQISLSNTKFKLNQPCLLQKGVQKSETQSFLACIADAFDQIESYNGSSPNIQEKLFIRPKITINDIKEIMKQRLTFDIFVSLQNGDLVSIFGDNEPVEVNDYKTSLFYRQLIKSNFNPQKLDIYFNKCVRAYTKFLEYLSNDSLEISYEFLWDFLSLRRKENTSGGMFQSGINLVILNSPDDDITSKIEVICPTSIYTANLYNTNKPILILYKRDKYFEPIYNFTKIKKNTYVIKKLFNIRDLNNEIPQLKNILSILWDSVTNKCLPLFSLPDVYNKDEGFIGNISPTSILRYLQKSKSNYNFKSQIVNLNNKVIALLLQNKNNNEDLLYLPCFPSAIIQTLPYEFIGRNDIWSSVNDTIEKLKYVNQISKNNIPSKPKIIAVNNNVIVGIITETNQFVPTLPEAFQVNQSELKVIQYNNIDSEVDVSLLNDNLLTENSVDLERILKVKQIKLETHFYNAFRNLTRIILSYQENSELKNTMNNVILKISVPYLEKLNTISEALRRLLINYTEFSQLDINSLKDIENIEQCINLPKDQCSKKDYCLFSNDESGSCKMIFPENNLINNSNNQEQYYIKLSDELIKFDRIRTFIFKPQTFLSFQEVPYSLNDDEIILLEDILYGDYFENLIPEKKNPFILNRNTWNSSEPIKKVNYVDDFNMDAVTQQEVKINNCIVTNPQDKKLSLGNWAEKGLGEYKIIEFKNSINCTWELFLQILNIHFKEKTFTIGEIVSKLIELISTLIEKDQAPILKIMKSQKKKAQAESIQKGTPIDVIINSTNYYLTTMDFCLLSSFYNIPLIQLSRSKIVTVGNKFISFIKNISDETLVYIVYTGPFYTSSSSKSIRYGLLEKDDSFQLSTVLMGDVYSQLTMNNFIELNNYISNTLTNIEKEKRVRIKIKNPLAIKKKTKIKIKLKSKK